MKLTVWDLGGIIWRKGDGRMIYTLTLNPAIDKTVEIPGFSVGAVNRITSVRMDVGGKGFNVSKCLQQLDCPSVAVGFLGGGAGKWMASELQTMNIPLLQVEIAAQTRTNLKIIDPEQGCNTDINEPGPEIQPLEMEALLELLDTRIQSGDLLILSGSLPKGLPPTLYRDLIARFQSRGAIVYLDADGENFRQGITAAPALIKPNLDELSGFFGQTLDSRDKILEAGRSLISMGIREVVISLGGEGALFLDASGCTRAMGLQVPVRSTVGAGDSMVAALAYGQTAGLPRQDRLRLAVAISAASVTCSGTQAPDRELIQTLSKQVVLVEEHLPTN